jgi:hypothetical protein
MVQILIDFIVCTCQLLLPYFSVFNEFIMNVFEQFMEYIQSDKPKNECPLITVGRKTVDMILEMEQTIFDYIHKKPQPTVIRKSRGSLDQCFIQPRRIAQAKEKYALLLGGDVTRNLGGAVNEDLKRVFGVLVTDYGINPKNIFIVTQLDQNFIQWREKQKTPGDQVYLKSMSRTSLIQALVDVRNKVKQVTSGVSYLHIHYSGHGVQVDDTSGDELDGKDEAITCGPTDVFTDDEFSAILLEQLPSNNHTIFFMDQCHSGSFGDLTYVYNPKTKKYEICTKKPKNHKAFISAIAACTDNQLDFQTQYKDGKDAGVLSMLFVEGVSKNTGVPFRYMLDNLPELIVSMNEQISGQVMQLTSSRA